MTKREERAIRKHRRILKRQEIDRRSAERVARREKRELAQRYSEEIIKKNGQISLLPRAPYCEVCGENLWCVHNLKRHINKEAI